MPNYITLDLKSNDYDKILNIVKKHDDELYKKILKCRDDNYIPKTKEYFEYYEDYSSGEEEDVVPVKTKDGFWELK
tara:strand:- start:1062 stop:1289 length:228 start_codon:yes stop_codon:yes gene_type:complete